MTLRLDDRGQAVQVGAILLFAALIIFLSVYQAQVVPSQNRGIEFESYQAASGDVVTLRNAILDAAGRDVQTGVTVETGTDYPSRVFFINPPPATGRVHAQPARNLTLSNATAASGGEVDEFWDGSAKNVSTRAIEFDPDYNVLSAESMLIEHGLTYRNASTPILQTGQTLVQGNRITVTTVTGDLDASGLAAGVTVEPVSAHTNTISIRNRTAGNLTLTLPSRRTAEEWRETILDGQIDAPGGADFAGRYVTAVQSGPRANTVNVTFEGNATYELRMSRVEVRETDDDAEEPTTTPHYVVPTTENYVGEGADARAKVEVEVRNRFNNPLSDEPVTFNASDTHLETADGTQLGAQDVTVETDADGRATLWFNGSNAGVETVDAYLGESVDDSLPAREKTQFQVTSSGTGPGGGAGGAEGAVFIYLDGVTASHSTDYVTFSLNNSGSSDLNLTGVQLARVSEVNGGGGDGSATFLDRADEITQIQINGGTPKSVSATERLKPAFFRNDPLTFPAGVNTVRLTFNENHSNSQNDQLMIRFHLFFEGGITATYDQIVFFN